MKAEFKDGFAVDFNMAVALCFKDSLANKKFHTGDTIYNDKRAYLSPWSNALKHIDYGFQVVRMEGKDIEYAVLRKKADGKSLATETTIKEPIEDFIQRLKKGYVTQTKPFDE